MKKLLISTAFALTLFPVLTFADDTKADSAATAKSAAAIPQHDVIQIGSQDDDQFGNAMQQRFVNMFDNFFGAGGPMGANKAFLPIHPIMGMARTDMYETKDNVIISMDIPGIKKEDVDIEIVPGVVSVKYVQKEEKESDDKDKNYKLSERHYGSFERQFSLPDYAETDKAEAEYKDGVLTITVPKNEKAVVKSKKVEIK